MRRAPFDAPDCIVFAATVAAGAPEVFPVLDAEYSPGVSVAAPRGSSDPCSSWTATTPSARRAGRAPPARGAQRRGRARTAPGRRASPTPRRVRATRARRAPAPRPAYGRAAHDPPPWISPAEQEAVPGTSASQASRPGRAARRWRLVAFVGRRRHGRRPLGAQDRRTVCPIQTRRVIGHRHVVVSHFAMAARRRRC